jgi:hypothetical protein
MACGRWPRVALTAFWAVACAFDSNTQGGSGALDDTQTTGSGGEESLTGSPTSEGTMSSATTSTSDPSTTTAQPSTTDPSDTATSSGSSGEPGGTADLQLSESAFDFAVIDVGASTSHTFTLTNTGDAAASGVTPVVMPAPFSIASTSCGASIDPEASCTIDVEFAPGLIGPAEGTLSVAYDDGQAAAGIDATLDGAGAGRTENLLQNADAESCASNEPSNWTEVASNSWNCIGEFFGQMAHGGATMIFAGDPPDGVNELVLAQTVAVPDDIAAHVLDGALGVRFTGWSQSAAPGDDPRRFRMEFLDAGGATLESWDSGWAGNVGWTETVETRVPALGTTQVRVVLECDYNSGTYCSALFDDVALHFVYPPS